MVSIKVSVIRIKKVQSNQSIRKGKMMREDTIKVSVMTLLLGIVMTLHMCGGVYAAEYHVGFKDLGWDFEVTPWGKDLPFKVGDILGTS